MRFDDFELPIPEDRADVEFAPTSLAQKRNALEYLLCELICDFIDDVDALGPAADVAAVQKRSHDRAAGRVVEVGVLTDDHRVLAAELQRARDELASTRFRDGSAGLDTSGERDLVDAGLGQRCSGLSIPHQDSEQAVGQADGFEEISHELARKRGDLGGFEEDGVSSQQRLNGWAEG